MSRILFFFRTALAACYLQSSCWDYLESSQTTAPDNSAAYYLCFSSEQPSPKGSKRTSHIRALTSDNPDVNPDLHCLAFAPASSSAEDVSCLILPPRAMLATGVESEEYRL